MTRAHQTTYNGLTAMQLWKKIPEGVRAEVINDVLYLSTSPTLHHQKVAMTLSSALHVHVSENSLGEVYACPIDVYMDQNNAVVIPDINYVSSENLYKLDNKGIHGAPDLLIEIYSPSTGKRDRTVKKDLYESMGVKEYWIVHPITKKAEGYLLENGRYNAPLELTSRVDVRILNKSFNF